MSTWLTRALEEMLGAPGKNSWEDVRGLIGRLPDGDSAERLTLMFLPLMENCLRRYQVRDSDADDAMSEMTLALLELTGSIDGGMGRREVLGRVSEALSMSCLRYLQREARAAGLSSGEASAATSKRIERFEAAFAEREGRLPTRDEVKAGTGMTERRLRQHEASVRRPNVPIAGGGDPGEEERGPAAREPAWVPPSPGLDADGTCSELSEGTLLSVQARRQIDRLLGEGEASGLVPGRAAGILRMRCGLGLPGPMSAAEAAEALGISEEEAESEAGMALIVLRPLAERMGLRELL